MAMPVPDKFQDSIQPTLAAAVGELAFRTLHRAIPAIPRIIRTGKIHDVRIVANPISDQLEWRTIAIAVHHHPGSAIATIAGVPIEFSAHELRRKGNAIVANPVAHPTLGVAIPIAIGHFTGRALLGPNRPMHQGEDDQKHFAHR